MIYFDYNATAPLLPEVAHALALAARLGAEAPGNPSSTHHLGRHARLRLDEARQAVGRLTGREPKEVCFTASGSEADALAIKGLFAARKSAARRRIVSSTIEHPAVLGTLAQLAAHGADIVSVPPAADGRVSAQAMIEALTDDTLLCTLMWANNETGVLQPVEEVSKACRRRGILFHTDAVQAVGKVPVRFELADMVSLSGHKFGGPAGAGALLAPRELDLEALVPGHQENGRRGGTPNTAYIEAFALALEHALSQLDAHRQRLSQLRDEFEVLVLGHIEDVTVNGASAPRLPNTSNLCFAGADGEELLIGLDLAGICVSAGAACASGTMKPSHVLTAMGLTPKQAHESLRFSLGPTATQAEVEQVALALVVQVAASRAGA